MISRTKVILYAVAVVIVIIVSIFAIFFVYNLLFGTEFNLKTITIDDDEGFPSLSVDFYASDYVELKIFGPSGTLIDTEYFYRGNHNSMIHLAKFRETISSGDYKFKVFDKNQNEIYEEIISFSNPELTISSYEQKWWKREVWKNSYSLVGLSLTIVNNGNMPVYPDAFEISIGSDTVNGLILPDLVKPGMSKIFHGFVYHEETPIDSDLAVTLKDINGNVIGSETIQSEMVYNVDTFYYNWTYDGIKRQLRIPNLDYLFDYYSSLERIILKDYSVFVFDKYDEYFLDFLVDRLMYGFNKNQDSDIVNYAASFVQKGLNYLKDSDVNDSVEYARYPIETLYNMKDNQLGGGDCEDLSILMVSILDKLDYDTALLRLPEHMAVGVDLGEDVFPGYDYYTNSYYFLETTTSVPSCGYVPPASKNPSELDVYPISDRPVLRHSWKDGNLTIYYNTERGDFVKVTVVIENLGSSNAYNIPVKGGFYTQYDQEIESSTSSVFYLESGSKTEVTLTVDMPSGVTTRFKTKVYLDDEVVDTRESASSFP